MNLSFEDVPFNTEVLLKAGNVDGVAFISDLLYAYRQHNSSLTHDEKKALRYFIDYMNSMETLIAILSASVEDDVFSKWLAIRLKDTLSLISTLKSEYKAYGPKTYKSVYDKYHEQISRHKFYFLLVDIAHHF